MVIRLSDQNQLERETFVWLMFLGHTPLLIEARAEAQAGADTEPMEEWYGLAHS